MISSEKDFLQFLDEHSFVYQRVEHPAVFTCAEEELHRPRVPAVSTKNLFLCDKKARRFVSLLRQFYNIISSSPRRRRDYSTGVNPV